MELDEMKSYWQAGSAAEKTNDEIKAMLKENRHPVLKRIRTQIVIELIGFTAFLLCYHSMFDGQDKPMIINVMLVMALMAQLLHHVYGYFLSKNLVSGSSISTSLSIFVEKFSRYVFGSLILRVLLLSALLIFFTYNIKFSAFKYYGLGTICTIALVQLLMKYRIDAKRIIHLRGALKDISEQ